MDTKRCRSESDLVGYKLIFVISFRRENQGHDTLGISCCLPQNRSYFNHSHKQGFKHGGVGKERAVLQP